MNKIVLKQVIHYKDTNSVEATWVAVSIEEFQSPILQEEEDGTFVDTGRTETKTREIETVVRCHSYADVQMDMFKEDIATYGGDITQYVELIATVEKNIVPYVAPALTEQDFTIAIQAHLDMTAQKTRWDNMQSARSCAGIPLDGTETDIEVAMHTDAVKLARWYLKVWAYGYAQLDLINKGEREVPVSVEAFIAELPLLN